MASSFDHDFPDDSEFSSGNDRGSDEIDSLLIAETDRLVLRTLGEGDEDAFIELCSTEGFSDFSSGRYRDMDRARAVRFREEERERYSKLRIGRFGVFERGEDPSVEPRLIGIGGLFEMNGSFRDSIEMGFRFVPECRGRGYGPEVAEALCRYAFGTLNLEQVLAIADPDNAPSHRALEKSGFVCLGNVIYHERTRQLWCREPKVGQR